LPDAKRWSAHSLATADRIEFLVAVRCFGYYCGITSVWVYFGILELPQSHVYDQAAAGDTKAAKGGGAAASG